MAVPRPILLLVVLGATLMAATFYTVRGGRETAVTNRAPSSVSRSVPGGAGATQHKAAPGKHAAAQPKHKAHTTKGHGKSAHARAAAARRAGAKIGLPADVARALGKRHIIVLFFFRPGAADDSATKRSVAAVRHAGRKVSVFSAPISKLNDYRRLISGLDISSAPATVVVGRDRNARVLEGFLDGGTLKQEVQDTKR
jgi:hypothetical protein